MISDAAAQEDVSDAYVCQVLRLTCLAPDIVESILEGRHPPDLTAARLKRNTRFPLDWTEQRKVPTAGAGRQSPPCLAPGSSPPSSRSP